MKTSKTAQRAKQTMCHFAQQQQNRRSICVSLLVLASVLTHFALRESFAQSPEQPTEPPVQSSEVTSVAADSSDLTKVSDKDFNARSRPLFDGQSLTGWEGTAYWFRVEDESVVAGRLEKEIPKNQFLCTLETFDDFDLRMEVRMRGEGRNAGVQFRSRRARRSEDLPANEVVGYQADMGRAWKRSVWGAVYDESRRKKMLVEPDPPFDVNWSPIEIDSDVMQTPWIEMRIVCKGNQIEVFLDGRRTVQYTEEDSTIPGFGCFGLQIHSGPPTEAWYRNIRILSL